MVKAHERFHSYKFCPRCKADVEAHDRFCRQCTFWLARPQSDRLRSVDSRAGSDSRGERFLRIIDSLRNFQSSFYFVTFGVSLGAVGVFLLIMLVNYIFPEWATYGPRAQKRACYSNMRVIQGAMEVYLQDTRFTPALASNPVEVLIASGCLNNRPVCPVSGNKYRIPRGSSLQCIGSKGHGLPY